MKKFGTYNAQIFSTADKHQMDTFSPFRKLQFLQAKEVIFLV